MGESNMMHLCSHGNELFLQPIIGACSAQVVGFTSAIRRRATAKRMCGKRSQKLTPVLPLPALGHVACRCRIVEKTDHRPETAKAAEAAFAAGGRNP